MALLLALSALMAAPVSAATVDYVGLITFAIGPLAGSFPRGALVEITYTLDEQVPDALSDPQRGHYPGAVESLSVSFPELGVDVITGPAGNATTNDNLVDDPTGTVSDQFTVRGGTIAFASLPAGEQLDVIDLVFLSDFVMPPAEPKMLKSDALPLSNVRAEDPFVLFETASGLTNVQFQDLSSVADDGCAIGGSSRDARGHAWLVLLPAVLLWARRRKSTVTRRQS